jgi:two-component system response regulator MprA
VWGGAHEHSSNVTDVYIGYLRRKLASRGVDDIIQTVRGLGYMLKSPPPA